NECWSKNKNLNDNKTKFTGTCHYCKKVGHKEKDCFSKKKNNNGSVAQSHVSHESEKIGEGYPCVDDSALFNDSKTYNRESSWILDTGATRHYTMKKDWLYNVKNIYKNDNNNKIITANGTSHYNMVGDVDVNINENRITLYNVAYVPDFTVNLLS